MKLTILLLFLAIAGYGQREIIESGISVSTSDNKQDPNYLYIVNCVTLQDYIKAYEADCYTTVLDTTQQCGLVKYDYIPVYENDVLKHYKAVAIDTVWGKPVHMKPYKYDSEGTWVLGSGISVYTTEFITTFKLDEADEVCIDYVYETLKRRVYPFSEDFWNFVKNYKQ